MDDVMIWWIDTKCFTNIDDSKTIYPAHFGDLLTFSSSATMRLTFIIFSEWIGMKFDADIHVAPEWIVLTYVTS